MCVCRVKSFRAKLSDLLLRRIHFANKDDLGGFSLASKYPGHGSSSKAHKTSSPINLDVEFWLTHLTQPCSMRGNSVSSTIQNWLARSRPGWLLATWAISQTWRLPCRTDTAPVSCRPMNWPLKRLQIEEIESPNLWLYVEYESWYLLVGRGAAMGDIYTY